ncbi:class I SAM-dependent methyltransferase [Anabaena sp. FACHB-1237]|nr:class I SAM-dependent methyltransferase [Anabaena sp. FACHB-1237]
MITVGILLFNPNISIATADTTSTEKTPEKTPTYIQQKNQSPDGIGKIYMGREIAKFVVYKKADWFQRSSREKEENPDQVIALLNLKPNYVVADIGTGLGYFTFRLAPLLPQGKVLAVDIQNQMLDKITALAKNQKITNIETVLGVPTSPNLPGNTVDLALIVNTYHEFAYPQEMIQGIIKSLKPGGKVVLVEYRGENFFIPIQRLHKMTQEQITKEMQSVGLIWRETEEILPSQHYMVFQKPDVTATSSS